MKTSMRSWFVVLAGVAMLGQDVTTIFKDKNDHTIGKQVCNKTGACKGYDKDGHEVGRFDGKYTYDKNGHSIGTGNQLSALVVMAAKK